MAEQEDKNPKRRKKLADVDVDLRDQIPKKLMKKLKDMNIEKKIDTLWAQGNAHRGVWLERQQIYMQSWDEFAVANSDGAFEGSSNLNVPMSFIVCKTYHARMLQALRSNEPTAVARREDGQDRAGMISDLLRYTTEEWSNNYKGVEDVLDQWLWSWITTGTGVLKWRWDKQYTKFLDIQKQAEAGVPTFAVNEEGEEVQIPTIKFTEKEVVRTKEVFDGPVLEYVNPEDILVVGGEGDIEKADAVLHQQFLTASELWMLADQKVFDSKVVKKVVDGGPNIPNDATADIKNQRAMNAGLGGIHNTGELDRYKILECYLKIDIDKSGINSDVVVWIHQDSGEILRATFLHRINQSGQRPFAKIDFHKRIGETYGVGLVEMIHPLAVELTAMRNIKVDYGLMSAMPIGFYRSGSTLNPETISLTPGSLIPCDDPQRDIYFPNLGNRQVFGAQEEASLMGYIERLTGISDLSLGVMSGKQGASRTASGVRAMLQESNTNLDVYLKRLNRGYKKVLEYLFHMLAQRLPPGFSFRVTGQDGANYWKQVNKEELCMDVDFEITANSAFSNPSVRTAIAEQILQLTSNPLDIQLGVVTPGHRYEALINLLTSLGIKEANKYVQKPQGHRQTFTPEEEVNRILRGIDVPVTPESDHEGFLTYYNIIVNDDEKLGQFGDDAALRLGTQAKEHKQMLESLKQLAAQQANVEQMQRNASMGSQEQTAPGEAPKEA